MNATTEQMTEYGFATPYGRNMTSLYVSACAINTVHCTADRARVSRLNHSRTFVKERRTNVINGNRMSRLEARLIENDFLLFASRSRRKKVSMLSRD